MPYIYKITNLLNGNLYIGKTSQSVAQRWKGHCYDKDRFSERPLYRALNKYGIENFSIEEIEQVETDLIAQERERYWIEYYGSFKKGYNATIGGDGKAYIDYDLVIATFDRLNSVKDTAELLNIGQDTASRIIKQFDRTIQHGGISQSKIVLMLDLNKNLLQSFPSVGEAARFLIKDQQLSPSNERGYVGHIGEVCRGKRKSCQGYVWEYAQ